MDSSMALSSYSSRLKCSLSNPPPIMMVPSPQLPGVLPLSSRRCGIASFAEFRGLRMEMGSKLSTSLVSICTRRNPKVFSRIVSEAHETFVDIPAVTDETWQSLIIEADGPVLVEFWAPWCGPCRIIHPVIAELSTEYDGKLKCFKLNTDESPSTTTRAVIFHERDYRRETWSMIGSNSLQIFSLLNWDGEDKHGCSTSITTLAAMDSTSNDNVSIAMDFSF